MTQQITKSQNQEITKFLVNPGDIVPVEPDGKSAGNSVIGGLDADDLAFTGDLELATITGIRQNQFQRQALAKSCLHLAVKESSERIHVAQCGDLQLVRLIHGGNSC